jgi:hypothetical protein
MFVLARFAAYPLFHSFQFKGVAVKSSHFAGAFRAACLLVSCIAFSALAQGNGVLTGNVIDSATKGPIADVVVTATSPNLQGEQVAVTDGTGLYRIPQLPPGTYSLRLEREGYKPFLRGDITLRVDQTLRFNAELLPEAIQAEPIIVVARPPTVDVGSTQLSTTIDSEMVQQLPLARPGGKHGAARSFEALAELAPSGQPDRYGFSLNGATSNENGFLIDGLSVNDPAYGSLGAPLSLEFIQEVNLISGGYMPEFGRATGGIYDVVTKSGTNEFHGSVFSYFSPGTLDGAPSTIYQQANAISTATRAYNMGSIGGELGGPLMKDKLWFYAGFSPAFTRYQLERNLNVLNFDANGRPVMDTNGFQTTSRIPGTQQNYFADQHSYQYIGKLTYLVNRENSLTFSSYGTPTGSGGNNKVGIDPYSGLPETSLLDGQIGAIGHQYLFNAYDNAAKWSSSFFDKRVLVDASVGWHHQNTAVRAMDGSQVGSTTGLASRSDVWWSAAGHNITEFEQLPDPTVCAPSAGGVLSCPVANYNTGGPRGPYWPLGDPISESSMDRYQGRVVGTFLGALYGHHIVKAGVDMELVSLQKDKGIAGTVQYTEDGNGNIIDYREFGYLQGPDNLVIQTVVKGNTHSNLFGAFVQDSWNVKDLVTVNAGIRWDMQTLSGTNGQVAISLPREFSPRLGLIYDFTHEGRSKIFASYARYYEAIPLNMVDRSFPGDRFLSSSRPSSVCNPSDPAQATGSCRNAANLNTAAGPNDPNQHWSGFNQDTIIVDPNLQPQSNDEIVAGGEYEVIRNGRLGLAYTHRTLNAVIEDMSRDEGFTFFIGNPGQGIAKNDFPQGSRRYDAVTLYFTKGFSELWLTQASYTYSNLRGNYSGLFRPENNQLEPNLTSDFDLKSLIGNRFGQLPADHTHTLKLFGAREFRVDNHTALTVGLSYIGRSGGPLNYLGAHYIYGPSEAFILPRGSAGRLDWVHSIDTHVGIGYRMSKDYNLSIGADVFNLFNFQTATAVDQNYTYGTVLPIDGGSPKDLNTCNAADPAQRTQCRLTNADGTPFTGATNPNFLKPIAYQPPRSIRFSARLSF